MQSNGQEQKFSSASTPFHEQDTVSDLSRPPAETTHAGQTWPAWPPPPRPRPTSGATTSTVIIAAVLALVLVIGGLGYIVFATTGRYRSSLHNQATSVAHATTQANAQTQQVEQGTAQALATTQAGINATATAQNVANATASVGSDSASATVTALNNLLTQDTTATPSVNDPMSDNTGSYQWDVGTTDNGNTGCAFESDGYHALQAQQGFLQPCFADATQFDNFVYKVTLTINGGPDSLGGMLLRASKVNGQYYLFLIDSNGNYQFEVYNNNNKFHVLFSGRNTAILAGQAQANTLAVIAKKNTFNLYANATYLATVSDSTFSAGQIGVAAQDVHLPVDITFSDVQIWKL